LSLLSNLFPTLILVVGMSDVIHIVSKYLDELHKGKDQKTALRIAIKEIGLATLLTSITTAIGFAALAASNISVIREFGLLAASGVFITYIAVILLTIATLSQFRQNQLANMTHHISFLNPMMLASYRLVKTHSKKIIVFWILLIGVCIFGITKISTNNYLLGDLPKKSEIREDMAFFEEKLSGIRPFELAVLAQENHKIGELAVLEEIEKLTKYLAEIPEISTVISPVTIYKSLNKSYHANKPGSYHLPKDSIDLKKYNRQLKRVYNKNISLLISDDKKHGRMTAGIRDIGSDSIHLINENIEKWIATNTNTDLVKFQLTGTGLLVDKNHIYLRKNLFIGLGLAFFIVSILMALLFRNWKMVIISLIPNIIPLIISGAVMGFMGITLSAATSIIFTLAFGIAVDDTIHFLSKFKLQLRKGYSVDEAIQTTYTETGKALCLTTVILFFSFMILATSSFQATYHIGLLVSITLFSALVADLYLLPILLYWWMED